MSADLISIKTRQLFREYFVGTSLRFISDEFDAARVDCDSAYQPPVSGARRSLVEQYYHSVNWTDWRDVKKVLQVFESILHTVGESHSKHGCGLRIFKAPESGSREHALLSAQRRISVCGRQDCDRRWDAITRRHQGKCRRIRCQASRRTNPPH